MIWLAAASLAQAQAWSEPRLYARPLANVSFVVVNGETLTQGTAGVSGGVFLRHSESPHWLSHTRAQVAGTVGLPTGSLGADVRLGSFIGPDTRFVRLQVGPDVWFNGYGTAQSIDYHLPYTLGLDLSSVLTLRATEHLQLIGEVTPGWTLAARRRAPDLGPLHELTTTVMVALRTSWMRLNVGYTRRNLAFGVYEGVIFSVAM
ncbi:MAG: hypothetical protein KTR31_11125 [Myxococcales bacterium]|nr:hypothetical protein [Myxococcales bacterium]